VAGVARPVASTSERAFEQGPALAKRSHDDVTSKVWLARRPSRPTPVEADPLRGPDHDSLSLTDHCGVSWPYPF
jgi:hypothetical protein